MHQVCFQWQLQLEHIDFLSVAYFEKKNKFEMSSTTPPQTEQSPQPYKKMAIPIVKVLPFDNKTTEEILPDRITYYRKGLLAWGDANTATYYGHLFHVVIVTAEEFDMTEPDFVDNVLRKRKTVVYWVPISEIANGKLTEENLINQYARQVRQATTQSIVVKTTKLTSSVIIMKALYEKKRVLVVCMAGKNRSTSTLINFLIFNNLSDKYPDCSILCKARKRNWQYDDWKNYLSSKRQFQIFPINDIQLTLLNQHVQSFSKIK